MVSLLCAAADLGRQLAHLIRRRSRSSRSRRAVDDDSEELPIDNVNTTSAGARSTIPRRHRLKRPQLPLPSRLHPSNSASPSVLSPPPMATSVGSRNTAGGRPSPPAASKPTTSLVKDSRTNKDVMPAINSKSSISGKAALQKPIITRNGIDQQKQTAVDSKNNIKAESEDKLASASSPAVSEEHCHQIGRFSIIDERQKDPGSLESDFDDLDDSISSQTPASPAATGSRDSSRSSTEPPASSSAYPSLDTVPNDPVIASPCFPGRHLAMTTTASHHHLTTASSRFKIVPVDSTFKRGRWTCWDYYDSVDTSNGGSKGSLLKVASHPNKLSLHHRCDMIEYDKGRISQSCSRHGSGNHADKSELLHHALTNAAFAHHDAKPATPAAQKDHHVVKFALGASEPSTPEEHTPTVLSPINTQGHAIGAAALTAGPSATASQTTPAKGATVASSKGPPTSSPNAAAAPSTTTLKNTQVPTLKMPAKATTSALKTPPVVPINISVSPAVPDPRSPALRSGQQTSGQTPLRLETGGGDQLRVHAGQEILTSPLLDRTLNTSHGERSLLENLLPGTIPPAGSPHNIGSADSWQQENTNTQGTGGAPNMVAIDSKIEQAMDLVKTHLMFAVREEVEILRAKIVDLETTVLRLESENSVLRDHIPADMLSKLLTPPSSNQNTISSVSGPPKATPA